jgi:hypothetical protein
MKGRTEGENAKEMKVLDWVADDRILLGAADTKRQNSSTSGERFVLCFGLSLCFGDWRFLTDKKINTNIVRYFWLTHFLFHLLL